MKTTLKVIGQAFVIVGVSAVIALSTNALRPDGIPVIAQVPYDIFAPCRDSEEQVADATSSNFNKDGDLSNVLVVDARPAENFANEHISGAINVPYSVLFGASDAGVKAVLEASQKATITEVIVYGAVADPEGGEVTIDLAKSLALELKEKGVKNVKPLKGDLTEMKKLGFKSVHKNGDSL